VNASMDTASENAHPSVVVLNGLCLEDDKYVCISVNAWIVIDWCGLGGDWRRISNLSGCTQRPSHVGRAFEPPASPNSKLD